MPPRRYEIAGLAPIFAAAMLAACAHPNPGFNAGAASAQAPANEPLATQPTVGQEMGAVAQNEIVVAFLEGAATLPRAEDAKLDLAVRLFRDVNPTLMFVAGHSDNRGEEYNNLLLSARRAETVKRALVARGIPSNRLLIQALGTTDPADTQMPASGENRRVVITWRLL